MKMAVMYKTPQSGKQNLNSIKLKDDLRIVRLARYGRDSSIRREQDFMSRWTAEHDSSADARRIYGALPGSRE